MVPPIFQDLETDIPAVFLAVGEEDLQKEKSSQSQWKEWYHSRELIFERKKRKKKGGRRSSSRRRGSSPSRRRSSQSRIVVSHTANSASVDSSLPTFLLLSRQVRKNLSPRHIQRDQREKGISRPIAPRFGPPWVAAAPQPKYFTEAGCSTQTQRST